MRGYFMKCLVIHGSPRRGNTWDVLKLTEEEWGI